MNLINPPLSILQNLQLKMQEFFPGKKTGEQASETTNSETRKRHLNPSPISVDVCKNLFKNLQQELLSLNSRSFPYLQLSAQEIKEIKTTTKILLHSIKQIKNIWKEQNLDSKRPKTEGSDSLTHLNPFCQIDYLRVKGQLISISSQIATEQACQLEFAPLIQSFLDAWAKPANSQDEIETQKQTLVQLRQACLIPRARPHLIADSNAQNVLSPHVVKIIKMRFGFLLTPTLPLSQMPQKNTPSSSEDFRLENIREDLREIVPRLIPNKSCLAPFYIHPDYLIKIIFICPKEETEVCSLYFDSRHLNIYLPFKKLYLLNQEVTANRLPQETPSFGVVKLMLPRDENLSQSVQRAWNMLSDTLRSSLDPLTINRVKPEGLTFWQNLNDELLGMDFIGCDSFIAGLDHAMIEHTESWLNTILQRLKTSKEAAFTTDSLLILQQLWRHPLPRFKAKVVFIVLSFLYKELKDTSPTTFQNQERLLQAIEPYKRLLEIINQEKLAPNSLAPYLQANKDFRYAPDTQRICYYLIGKKILTCLAQEPWTLFQIKSFSDCQTRCAELIQRLTFNKDWLQLALQTDMPYALHHILFNINYLYQHYYDLVKPTKKSQPPLPTDISAILEILQPFVKELNYGSFIKLANVNTHATLPCQALGKNFPHLLYLDNVHVASSNQTPPGSAFPNLQWLSLAVSNDLNVGRFAEFKELRGLQLSLPFQNRERLRFPPQLEFLELNDTLRVEEWKQLTHLQWLTWAPKQAQYLPDDIAQLPELKGLVCLTPSPEDLQKITNFFNRPDNKLSKLYLRTDSFTPLTLLGGLKLTLCVIEQSTGKSNLDSLSLKNEQKIQAQKLVLLKNALNCALFDLTSITHLVVSQSNFQVMKPYLSQCTQLQKLSIPHLDKDDLRILDQISTLQHVYFQKNRFPKEEYLIRNTPYQMMELPDEDLNRAGLSRIEQQKQVMNLMLDEDTFIDPWRSCVSDFS